MAKTPVTGRGPIEFTDDDAQIVIPLSDFYLDDNGVLTSDSTLYTNAKSKAGVDAWLKELQAHGVVKAATLAPPAPAMVITARAQGSSGNNISIAFSNVDPDAGTFDAELQEQETYLGLTAGGVKDVLGTAAGGGTSPGLVFVSSAGAPAHPGNGLYPVIADPGGSGNYIADIGDGAGGTAFTVQSRAVDAEATHTVVEIKDAADPQSPGTFTLVGTWKKPKAVGVQPAGLQGGFAYEITVAPPAGGQLGLPAAGTVALRGGANAAAPAAASATVFAAR
jgi:hypothetical protein